MPLNEPRSSVAHGGTSLRTNSHKNDDGADADDDNKDNDSDDKKMMETSMKTTT